VTHPVPSGDADASRQPLAGRAASGSPGTGTGLAREGQGAEQEFACFYREHFARLVAYLIYQGAAVHRAADLAQDAMIEVYRRWPGIQFPRAYVYKAAGRAFVRRALEVPELPVGEVPEPTSVLPCPGEAEAWLQAQRPLSDNGTMVGVKEPTGAALTPLAVPMSPGAGHGSACNGLIASGELVAFAALRCGPCRLSS
jgi:hypothetical protein